jgi:hypothetical protein
MHYFFPLFFLEILDDPDFWRVGFFVILGEIFLFLFLFLILVTNIKNKNNLKT